jgi:co-chaperonin GroES (HSP10)
LSRKLQNERDPIRLNTHVRDCEDVLILDPLEGIVIVSMGDQPSKGLLEAIDVEIIPWVGRIAASTDPEFPVGVTVATAPLAGKMMANLKDYHTVHPHIQFLGFESHNGKSWKVDMKDHILMVIDNENKRIIPTGDSYLLWVPTREKTASGLYVNPKGSSAYDSTGIIIACGEKTSGEVNVGDRVVYSSYGWTPVKGYEEFYPELKGRAGSLLRVDGAGVLSKVIG